MIAVIEFVGTMMLAAMLSVMVFQMKFETQKSLIQAKLLFYMQSNSTIFGQTLRNDLKQMGYNIDDIYNCIKDIDEKSITYTTDVNEDNVPEVIKIAIEDYTNDDPTVNPYDQKVVKYTNGTPEVYHVKGVTNFKFKYFDHDMLETNVPSEVKIINFTYRMLSDEPMDYMSGTSDSTKYAVVIAEEKVFLKNIWDW
jgi:hypothetical protein